MKEHLMPWKVSDDARIDSRLSVIINKNATSVIKLKLQLKNIKI